MAFTPDDPLGINVQQQGLDNWRRVMLHGNDANELNAMPGFAPHGGYTPTIQPSAAMSGLFQAMQNQGATNMADNSVGARRGMFSQQAPATPPGSGSLSPLDALKRSGYETQDEWTRRYAANNQPYRQPAKPAPKPTTPASGPNYNG